MKTAMKTMRGPAFPAAAKLTLAVLVLAALSGAAFAMWIRHGAGIFMALVESGLAWCY